MYNTANNSFGKFEASIGPSATSFIMQSAYSELFPLHNGTTDADYFLKLEQKDVLGAVTKREIVKVTARSGVIFTIVRGAGLCPASDTATTQTNTAFSFSAGDSISLTVVSEHIQQIEDDIIDLNTNKANDVVVVHKTGNEIISGVKTFSSSPKAPDPTDDDDVATKGYVQETLEVSKTYKTGLIAGEDLDEGEFARPGINTTIAYSGVGNISSNTTITTGSPHYQTFSFAESKYNVSSVMHRMESNSGTHTVSCEIRADDGVTVLATAVSTVVVGVPQADYTFTFSTPPTLLPGITYRIYWIGGNSNLYHRMGTNVYSDGQADFGPTYDYYFSMSGNRVIDEDTTKRYKAVSLNGGLYPKNNAVYGVGNDVVVDGTFLGVSGGDLGGYTGLTPGTVYYLKDDGSIGITAGTVSMKVGRANSTTNINFVPPL